MNENVNRDGSRRSFVRKGLAGLCACGCAGGLLGATPNGGCAAGNPWRHPGEGASLDRRGNPGGQGTRNVPPDPHPQDPGDMPRSWIAVLATSLSGEEPATARRLLRSCSTSHWEALGMDAVVEPFCGDLPAFLDFLRSEWGWIIEYDAGAGLVEVNENKAECVCPLVAGNRDADLGALCYCSEGFAERLFGAVVRGDVRAEVADSILRGGDRCRYRIQLEI